MRGYRNAHQFYLICSTRETVYSGIIRYVDWAKFSHVAITDGYWVWESTRNYGVHKIPLPEFLAKYNSYIFIPIVGRNDKIIQERLDQRKGEKYSRLNILKTLFRIDWVYTRAGYCSVYVGWVLDYDGKRYPGQLLNRLSPRHIRLAETIRFQEFLNSYFVNSETVLNFRPDSSSFIHALPDLYHLSPLVISGWFNRFWFFCRQKNKRIICRSPIYTVMA